MSAPGRGTSNAPKYQWTGPIGTDIPAASQQRNAEMRSPFTPVTAPVPGTEPSDIAWTPSASFDAMPTTGGPFDGARPAPGGPFDPLRPSSAPPEPPAPSWAQPGQGDTASWSQPGQADWSQPDRSERPMSGHGERPQPGQGGWPDSSGQADTASWPAPASMSAPAAPAPAWSTPAPPAPAETSWGAPTGSDANWSAAGAGGSDTAWGTAGTGGSDTAWAANEARGADPAWSGAPAQASPPWPGPPADVAQPTSPDPSRGEDPYKPFVTAGQISGPKTPPAHRQQELWDTVFGDTSQTMDDYDDERGRPVWVFALVTTVILALIGGLVWAFVAGPLSSGDTGDTSAAPSAEPTTSAAAAKPEVLFPALAAYKGTPSPVKGTVPDPDAALSLPRLRGPWKVDTNAASIRTTYGFSTRQYVPAGMTTRGKQEFAQVMSGPLPESLASKYTSPSKLTPVVAAVMTTARQTFFPKGSTASKVAQQRYSHNGITGLLVTYKVTADHEDTTVAVAALNTGGDLPAIVYVAVPELKDDLLPDINSVFKSTRKLKAS
ncbi:hypothetical protein [Planotetraspora kaengkrachanensis]|uniref:hypothetical protein n=1 Tax=Planotetraspora kaengkrachanensis TaxID=575193 RepID=UPI001941972A|nr:hypothetical protein [Planotetraspora kaengkrachanensis]